ncbi:MAG: hypothetical protein R2748_05545 [Bryobacterales bacterium]
MEFERRAGPAAPWLLGAWLAAGLALAAPAVWRLLDYFHSPGPQFFSLILAVAPALVAASLAYAYWRPPALRRAEPWLFAGLAVGAPLLWKPVATLAALALLAASIGVGRRLLELYRLPGDSPVERTTLAAGVGLALAIPALWAFGPSTGYWVWVIAGLASGFGVLAVVGQDLLEIARAWSASTANPFARVAVALAFPFLGLV